MATSIFERPHHQRIARLLGSLNVDLLARAEAYFGGGTAIALSLGEFRESRDVDFLVSAPEGYRLLREAVSNESLGEILREPAKQLRDVRMDRYSIRTVLEIEGEPIRIEFISEGELEISGAFNPELGVPTLSRDDMYATKLLANANRALDKSVLSRDIIDLAAMVDSWGDIPRRVWDRTVARFGGSIERGFHDALRTIADRRYLVSCLDQMGMDPNWLDRIPAILSKVTLLDAKRTPPKQTAQADPVSEARTGRARHASDSARLQAVLDAADARAMEILASPEHLAFLEKTAADDRAEAARPPGRSPASPDQARKPDRGDEPDLS